MNQSRWNTPRSEQSTIDRLVEAVEAGDAEEKLKQARHLLVGYASHDWHLRRVIDAGIILPKTSLDPRAADPEDVVAALEESEISDTRLDELSNGAPMTIAEGNAWRRYVVERAFEPELAFERGDGNVCVVLELKHSDSRRVHLAIRNWDGQSGVLVAVYSTYSEAMNALRSTGIVSMDDYLAWEELHRSKG